MAPTLCDATEVAKPANRNGESLWPQLLDEQKSLARRKPLVWGFSEYGGQVALRIGDMKLVRRDLKAKKPGPWEVYDLKRDRSETTDLAASQGELLRRAEDVLRCKVDDNEVFLLTILVL